MSQEPSANPSPGPFRWVWILLACLWPVTAPAGVVPPGVHLQHEMQQVLEAEGLVGAVWSVSTDESGPVVGATGLKNADTREPMQSDTRVQVGSVTKAVLAVGVLRLITQQRLSLDTPVSALLPGVLIDNPWERSDPVRIRHLLAHTAGLENLRLWQFFSLQPSPDTPLADAFARATLRVQTRPGNHFGYSNAGYTLLGMVIESVTGERYETWLDRELLPPLEMHDSRFAFTSQTGAAADPRLAMGHFENATAHPVVPLYLRPAAQFTTTAADMATFAHFLMGNGQINGTPFVEAALLADAARPAPTDATRAGLPLGHGHILVGRDRRGAIGGCHPGNTVGFWAMLCVYPQHKAAFFVATNSDSETADYERLNALLQGSLALPPDPPTLPHAPASDLHEWDGFYIPRPAAMPHLAGLEALTGFVRVRIEHDALRIRAFPSGERRLTPVGGRLFRAEGRSVASHVLLHADDGNRVLNDGLRNHVRVHAARIVLPWMSLIACLSGVLWVIGAGSIRAFRRLRCRTPLGLHNPLFVPLLGTFALLLPMPFLLQQSLLQLGDRTAGSLLLAAVTTGWPLCLLAGVLLAIRRWCLERRGLGDLLALVLILQAVVLLLTCGLWPVRLWTW